MLDRLDRAAAAAIAALARHKVAGVFAILLVGLLALLPGQGALPLLDADEARFVQASRQMLETGDFIDIRNQDAPRYKKPVGIYWLQSAAATLQGGGAEAPMRAFRLPSLAGILAAALFTGWALLPLAGPGAAGLAGIALATSLLTVAEGHIAKSDAVLLACIAALQAGLLRSWLATRPVPARWLFWVALAAGTLVKGPLAPMVAGFTLAGLMLRDRSTGLWRRLTPLRGAGLFLLVTLPWFIAIGFVSHGGFYAAAVGTDLMGKVAQGAEGHAGPPGYYLATVWLTFFPWAPFALLALPWAWQQRRAPLVAAVAAWVLPMWLVFALAGTKLPHYLMPVFPALAMLAAAWLAGGRSQRPAPGWLRWVAAALMALPALLLAGLVAYAPAYVQVPYAAGPLALAVLGLAAALAAALSLAAGRIAGAAALALAAALTLTPALIAGTLPRLAPLFPSPRMAALDARLDACVERPVLSIGYREMSLVALAGTDTEFPDVDEAARRLAEGDGWRVFVTGKDDQALEALRAATGRPLEILANFPTVNYNQSDDRLTTRLVALKGDATLAACNAPAG